MKSAKCNHLEGIFHLDEDAGDPVDDVTELHYKVNDERLGYARHELPEATWLTPGRSTRALLTFVRPGAMLPSLSAGLELDVYRGTQKIGTLHITSVSKLPFGGHTEALSLTRLEPPARTGISILISVVYFVFTLMAVYLAVKAYTPCESNFEGSCSIGRSMVATASLVPAAMATILGVFVKREMDKFSALESRMALEHNLLWFVPLIYILITINAMFRG